MFFIWNIKTMKNPIAIGLSARQKTFKFPRSSPLLLFLLGVLLALSSCNEKTNGQPSAKLNKDQTTDSLSKPKVNINVNRHYDDKGNVIGFDSTYTSFYSNVAGDTVQIEIEKIQAVYENGILNLVIPKKDEAKSKPARRITVL